MKYKVDLQDTVGENTPNRFLIQRWVNETLSERIPNCEVCIRIVDSAESQSLNSKYRNTNKPTNVLSFPYDIPKEVELESRLLGDLVVCSPIIETEAKQQGKNLEAHWAHMIIHGTLHLLGYDHIQDAEAVKMEAIEVELLKRLGYQNPYEGELNDR